MRRVTDSLRLAKKDIKMVVDDDPIEVAPPCFLGQRASSRILLTILANQINSLCYTHVFVCLLYSWL